MSLSSFAGQNTAPQVFDNTLNRRQIEIPTNPGSHSREPIDALEVFDMIRDINDPEHPLTLEQLNVVQMDLVKVDDEGNRVVVEFVPTIPHCSASTLIGLSIRTKLERSLPSRFKIDVKIVEGGHVQQPQINKQLNDKERVAAATENASLLDVVHKCLAPPGSTPALLAAQQ